ncbi:MAG: Coenzyme F420 hydrogenase/dehydrogenase, beta subunit C-terminal domain [Candidatus Bathyarchaeia archaeon]
MTIKVTHFVCSGCGLCVALCPRKALRLGFSVEGHFKPFLNRALCNNCGLCVKICPFTSSYNEKEVKQVISNFTNRMIGDYLRVGLAWSTDKNTRFRSASGGAVTSILKYLLEKGIVNAVLAPKVQVKQGLVFGSYEIVCDGEEIQKYAGSIYAPVDITKALREAFARNLRIALVGLPCQVRGLRNSLKQLPLLNENIKVVFGLYCYNLPSSRAVECAIKMFLRKDPEEILHIAFRGGGWPGYTTITTKDGKTFKIPSQAFWDSGFGQYFYGKACLLCPDHTAELADISFADPWTYQRNIGAGKTLVIIRTKPGLEVLNGAVKSGHLGFEEIPAIHAVQHATLLKKTVKVTTIKTTRYSYELPLSISSVVHELDYLVGSRLAKYKRLWSLLRLYVKSRPYLLKHLITLDYLLKTELTRMLDKISRTWL